MEVFEDFIFVRSYSRWLPELKRRETYEEAVTRYCDFIFNETKNCDKIPVKTKKKIKQYILDKGVLPSLRLLWAAGENARRDNIAAYNCSALCVDSLDCFEEAMYILLAGAGCGFSVEKRYIEQLPVINKQRNLPPLQFTIPDTRLGWKEAVGFVVKEIFAGRDVQLDYSLLRPVGTPLITSGGYASGPDPLRRCLEFIRETLLAAQGRQLTSLEISDCMNEVGASIVCGGVRRSSEICLTDVDDVLMRDSKQGINTHPRRFMANISSVYRKQPSVLDFTQEFINMAKSGSGERGLFNLVAARKRTPKRRDAKKIIITNPCGETLLRNRGLCNLSEVVIRADDDFDSIQDKIKCATWIGCIQSTLTNFPHLRPEWKANAEEERLLGVSLTGLCDNINSITPETLRHWKRTAIKTAKEASAVLEINMPAAITLGKPSGTASLLCNTSSGMHSRWAPYYIRRVRISTHDSLFKMMVDQGMSYDLDEGNHDTAVFSFPIKSPEGCKTRSEDTAIGQLEWYKMLVENWCEQNMSCTIFVKDHEWLEVCAYIYKNFDSINGIALFPYDNKKYNLPPYEEIDELTYKRMANAMPDINFSALSNYEDRDNTEGARTLACSGAASCEL